MQKAKAKRESRWQTQMLPFVVVWALTIVAVIMISSTLMRAVLYPLLTSQGAGIASNLVPVILTGLVQVFLVERLLKRSMRGWMLLTTISGFVTVFMIHVVARSYLHSQNQYVNTDIYMLLNYIAYYVPAPLLQFFWLRRHVKKAWLWPIISILVMVLFSVKGFLTRDYGSGLLEAMVEFLAYGVVQASLMHYLWKHPRDAEKTKVDFAADQEADEKRIERLKEQDRSTPLWNRGDEQTLQHESQ